MKYLILISLLLVACGEKDTPLTEYDLINACPYKENRVIPEIVVTSNMYDNHFDSGDVSEAVECLPVGEKPVKKVIYTIKLTDLRAGDIIMVNGQMEITNELQQEERAMLAGMIILSNGPEDTKIVEELTEPYGYNCERWVHHCTLQTSGYFKVKKDHPEIYLNMVAYSVALSMKNIGTVKVERDYGRLSGTILRE